MRVARGILGGLASYVLLGCASAPAGQANVPQPVRSGSTALVHNVSRVTQCAEEDNVYVTLAGVGLAGMRIEARQPSYIAQLSVDDSKADFTDCHFDKASNPVYHFAPKKVVLWETERFLMIGNTYETFWRPDEVDVVIAGQVTKQIHLIQLHVKDASEPTAGRHEFIAMYPVDGYWRVKPIPRAPMTASTYGTSFLIGPVKDAVRPVVELSRVEFVPERLSFLLDYEDGSHGEMHLTSIDQAAAVLDYAHDRAVPESQPLAAIRSMFVTPERSDVAEVTLRTGEGSEPSTQPLPSFTRAEVSEVAFGRSLISKHNPSAPDMWFGRFVRGADLARR